MTTFITIIVEYYINNITIFSNMLNWLVLNRWELPNDLIIWLFTNNVNYDLACNRFMVYFKVIFSAWKDLYNPLYFSCKKKGRCDNTFLVATVAKTVVNNASL